MASGVIKYQGFKQDAIRKDNIAVDSGGFVQIDITSDIPAGRKFICFEGFDVWDYANKLVCSPAATGIYRVINVDTMSRVSTIIARYLYQ